MITIRKIGLIILVGACLASCDKYSITVPTFEIRDFGMEEQWHTYTTQPSDVTYKGRGTVIATPKGNYLLYLRHRDPNRTAAMDEEMSLVFVMEGTGIVRTHQYINNPPKDSKPPKYKWEVLGYSQIMPGKLVVRE